MSLLLYKIIISPIEFFLGNLFSFFFSYLKFDVNSSVFFISLTVCLISLPFYSMAEDIRNKEEEKISELNPYIKKIKNNFKGDEQYFLLKTLYRQHDYNPVLSFRNSLTLLLLVPFFVAAYHFFSNLNITGYKFGLINDLSEPDKLINFLGLRINLLPFCMTFINMLSCELYLKDKSFKAKIQQYSFSLLFLVVLYNSPSILLIYWIYNNLFYLFKYKYMDKCPKKFWGIILFFVFFFFISGTHDNFIKNTSYYCIYSNFLPHFIFLLLFLCLLFNFKRIKKILVVPEKLCIFNIFLFCSLSFILLQGLIIPLGLIDSDLSLFVTEFNDTKTVIKLVLDNFLFFSGLYLFWSFLLFYLIKKEFRIYYTVIFMALLFNSLFNFFSFGRNLGNLDFNLYFTNKVTLAKIFSSNCSQIINGFVFIFILALLLSAFKKSLDKQLKYIVFTLMISELIVSGILIYKLSIGIKEINNNVNSNNLSQILSDNIELSKTKKNVIIIFLDRFVGGFLPIILEEKPELKKVYSGFVFYPNTVSFYGNTALAYPPCLGGYEYTPYLLDKDKRHYSAKLLESSLMLLMLFKNNNYISTIVNHIGEYGDALRYFNEMDYSLIFSSRKINHINNYRIDNKFQRSDFENENRMKFFQNKISVYSFFYLAPKMFKRILYDDGNYLTYNSFSKKSPGNYFFKAYSSLINIKDITKCDSDKNTFTLINNDLPHEMAFLQYPEYKYVENVTEVGVNKFGDNTSFMFYHTSMAAALIVGEYLNLLKQMKVYDNSRIIIVADHGNRFLTLPDYTDFQNENVTPFNPLLLVKDFNQNFELKEDRTFMTNADVPYLATNNLLIIQEILLLVNYCLWMLKKMELIYI